MGANRIIGINPTTLGDHLKNSETVCENDGGDCNWL